MVNLDLIEFLDKHDINWMPINLEFKKWGSKMRKILKPYQEDKRMPSYNELGDLELVKQRQKWIDNYNNIWIDTRFVNQIDVDGETDPNLETPYFESVTKKKKHYFVKGFCGFSKKRAPTKWDDVELLCGQGSYASKKAMVYCSEKEMIDYCGRVQNVLTKDNEQTANSNRSNTNLNPNISQSLNEIFTTKGEWKSNYYENSRCVVLIPSRDKQCIVSNTSKIHSCVQCYLSLGKTSCIAKCHSCGEKKIDVKKNASTWKQIRNYFELGNSEENVNYDTIQEFVDEYCSEHDLMKKDGFMMRRSEECPIEYEKVAKFSVFLDNIFRNEAPLALKRVYKKPSSKRNLVDYLQNIHTDIRILERDSNILAFTNGFLNLKQFKFYSYDQSKGHMIAKKYIPFDFDVEWLNMSWDEIDCPVFDKIIGDQPQLSSDENVTLAFYGLLGSLHYPVGGDSIKVVPYLVGTSGTGKSTIVNIYMNTFSEEIVGTINYKEKTFGKSAFIDHDIICDQDTPADMIKQFGKTDFQKAVSGETIAIPIKNQKQEEQHKVTQRMFFCSQYMQEIQDTGEVIRRIAYFGFEPVQNTRSDLENSCLKTELHLVLIKTLLARRALIEKYKTKPFHEWNISYFDSRKDDILMENNYIYRMVSEHDSFRVRRGARCSFDDFVREFHEHYRGQPNRPKKPKVTDVMFTKMGLSVIKEIECKDCRKPFSPNVKCCALHSPCNKTSRYYIKDLWHGDFETVKFCNISDDNDVLPDITTLKV